MKPLAMGIAVVATALLTGCGGGSSSGGGTANSPFVGTYNGATAVTVVTRAGSETASNPISMFVNSDGLVQFGADRSTIYASGFLHGNNLRIVANAAVTVDPQCSGTITLSGNFSRDGGSAKFEGQWSSQRAECFGISGTVSGPISAIRSDPHARTSRVFETHNPTLLRAFRGAIQ